MEILYAFWFSTLLLVPSVLHQVIPLTVRRSFLQTSSDNPWPLHSLFSNCQVLKWSNSTIPFSPSSTMSWWSANESKGWWKLYVKSPYHLESPLPALQPIPPLCSPISNCCSAPSPWKTRITSLTLPPWLVSTLWGSWSRHSEFLWSSTSRECRDAASQQ